LSANKSVQVKILESLPDLKVVDGVPDICSFYQGAAGSQAAVTYYVSHAAIYNFTLFYISRA